MDACKVGNKCLKLDLFLLFLLLYGIQQVFSLFLSIYEKLSIFSFICFSNHVVIGFLALIFNMYYTYYYFLLCYRISRISITPKCRSHFSHKNSILFSNFLSNKAKQKWRYL